jgi:hypothetical protein
MIAKFNEQEYEVSIFLDNNQESIPTRQFFINPSGIVNLTIEETLADWVVKGSITIYESFNNIENKSETQGELADNNNFYFKNDGTDILTVKIFPKLNVISSPADGSSSLEVNRVHWELVYKFAIYDVEDIELPPGAQNAASNATKCKKYYFWDRWYQTMMTDIMEYSTGASEGINIAIKEGKYDGDLRALPTGIIMREIINKCLTKNNIYADLKYPDRIVGGNNNTSWDEGASKIFYTAPANTTAYESLMYVYSRHVSSKSQSVSEASGPRGGRVTGSLNDFCILTKDRGPKEGDEGYFTLMSMSEYFDKAGKTEPKEFQIERFLLQGYAPEKKKPTVKRAPKLNQQNMQIDTKLEQYSLISSYRFVDISPVISTSQFRTTPVCSFDFNKRMYRIEFAENSIGSAKQFITKQYISKVLTEHQNTENNFLINIDKSRENYHNVMPVFSLYGDYDSVTRQADGLQKLLKTGVFQNACIHFRTLGSTNRTSGRFITIDRDDAVDDNNFNNKFLGQWFIISVHHIFEGGMYYNEIIAVKLHRFKPLQEF